jgi:predicted alpha/beta-fold hydrolase
VEFIMDLLSAAPMVQDFRPLPLLGNPHVQTILGVFLPGHRCPKPRRRHVVALPDGDALLLQENTPRSWRPHRPAALVVHGLTGTHSSPHIRRQARMLLDHGVRVFRIDLRGARPGLPLARGNYHAGQTDDLRVALAYIHSLAPAAPLLLAGMSLGAALALRLAGELPEHPVPGLARVAALNPPIDLVSCSRLIELKRNRIYEKHFVRGLVEDAVLRRHYFPDLPEVQFPKRLTLRQFDDLYTAPRNGFVDAMDYYSRVASAPLIPRITVPTLILTSRDDPFIAVEPFEALRAPEHVQVHIAARGGHVGFVGRHSGGGFRWGERSLVEWLCAGSER